MIDNNTPLVSIVALCYNHASYCLETLDSIYQQTYPNYELIIMDDCSTDDSVQIIEQWVDRHTDIDVKFVAHKENQGVCKTLNEAISYTNGEYIAMIACDDAMMPEKTEKQVVVLMESQEDVGLVYSDAYLMKSDSSVRYGWFIQKHRDFTDIPSGDVYDQLLVSNFIPAMTTMIKKSVYDTIGKYDESLGYEDYDMWLRMAKKYKFLFDDYASAKYRLHEANLHKSYKGFLEDKIVIYSKHPDSRVAQDKINDLIVNMYDLNGRKHCVSFIGKHLKKSELNKNIVFCIKNGLPAKVVRYLYFKGKL